MCLQEAAPTESLLNWQDYEGRTPLHFAVADGNEAVVKVLTSYQGCNVTAYDNLFRTPLHWAALLGEGDANPPHFRTTPKCRGAGKGPL